MTPTPEGMPPPREPWDVAGNIFRSMRALARRAADGDTAAAEQLLMVHRESADILADAARGLHAAGYSWQVIGDLMGIHRTSAWERFGKK